MSEILNDNLQDPNLGNLAGATLEQTNYNLATAGYPPVSQEEFELVQKNLSAADESSQVPEELFNPGSTAAQAANPEITADQSTAAQTSENIPTQTTQEGTQQAAQAQPPAQGIGEGLYNAVKGFFQSSWENQAAVLLGTATLGLFTYTTAWPVVAGWAVKAFGVFMGLNPGTIGLVIAAGAIYMGLNYFFNKD